MFDLNTDDVTQVRQAAELAQLKGLRLQVKPELLLKLLDSTEDILDFSESQDTHLELKDIPDKLSELENEKAALEDKVGSLELQIEDLERKIQTLMEPEPRRKAGVRV